MTHGKSLLRFCVIGAICGFNAVAIARGTDTHPLTQVVPTYGACAMRAANCSALLSARQNCGVLTGDAD